MIFALGILAANVASSIQDPPRQLAPPIPWANGFCPQGRDPFVTDVNGDGIADLLCVSPQGDAFIDVALTLKGGKCKVPQRALSNWGKNCEASAVVSVDGKAEVLGLFEGDTVRVARGWNNRFSKNEVLVKLPSKISKPRMAVEGAKVRVWSTTTGTGFSFDFNGGNIAKATLPKGTVWAETQPQLLTMDPTGRLKSGGKTVGEMIGGGLPVRFGSSLLSDEGQTKLPGDPSSRWASGDMDGDGDVDLVEYRFSQDRHFGNNVLIHRFVSPNETDSDYDGLPNVDETRLGTDPLNPDTDGDGLLDGWEVGTYRDLDFKSLGCDPKKPDVICLISRFAQLDEKMSREQIDAVVKYYQTLNWNLHPIFLDPIPEAEQARPWWEQRDRLRPAKWKGIVHWMQITPFGGGQADQLGDGGGCGGNGITLYATFVHEFGHQLGLPHEGFYGAAWCPTYPSLMNYAYSYTLEGDIRNVRYSDGRLADWKLNESNLSEIIPLPYEKIKFLENAPYRYRLRADGDRTLIDWNWNGIFGEENVRADINYSYSTTAGVRDNAGKLHSAPWLFTHEGKAFALFARHDQPADVKTDPTVSKEKPGSLVLRGLIEPTKWHEPQVLVKEGVVGDPQAISFGGEVFFAYPSLKGVVLRRGISDGAETVVDSDSDKVPSFGTLHGRLFLAVWDPKTQRTTYRWWEGTGQNGKLGSERLFNFVSTVPPGFAYDSIQDRLIVGLAWDQDAARPSRWQVRRYSLSGDSLLERAKDWIEGEKGGARGKSRPVVLFDPDLRWGKQGRTYFFSLGMTSPQTPWSCAYVAHDVGDKTVGGGWQVKRYYDEWTQSRSAPAATWFNGDILYGYRWVDGAQTAGDNILHIGYRGSGLEDAVMGDFDDISFIRNFGMRYSILYMFDR